MGGHDPKKGVQVVAEMLVGLEPAHRARLLSNVQARDPGLAAELRKKMHSFDDLARMNDTQMQLLLRQIPQEKLALALRALSPELKEVIFRNLTTRAANAIREEMLAQGPRRLSDVQRVQQEIADLARRLMPAAFK